MVDPAIPGESAINAAAAGSPQAIRARKALAGISGYWAAVRAEKLTIVVDLASLSAVRTGQPYRLLSVARCRDYAYPR
jgi:hypothetical protein